MKTIAYRAYLAADLAYGVSLIVTGLGVIGFGLLIPHI